VEEVRGLEDGMVVEEAMGVEESRRMAQGRKVEQGRGGGKGRRVAWAADVQAVNKGNFTVYLLIHFIFYNSKR
jgi:hypothetical protein